MPNIPLICFFIVTYTYSLKGPSGKISSAPKVAPVNRTTVGLTCLAVGFKYFFIPFSISKRRLKFYSAWNPFFLLADKNKCIIRSPKSSGLPDFERTAIPSPNKTIYLTYSYSYGGMDKSSGDKHTCRPLKPLVIKGIWVLSA
jgi:hypothetical protein